MSLMRTADRAMRVIPDDLRRLQVEASDPAVSAWVAANAGSGKTHVLAQRVIRLLLDGVDPAGEQRQIEFRESTADVQADRALDKLATVAKRFEDEQQPYLPLVLSMWKNRYGTYDHLARVKEWSVAGPDDAEGGE